MTSTYLIVKLTAEQVLKPHPHWHVIERKHLDTIEIEEGASLLSVVFDAFESRVENQRELLVNLMDGGGVSISCAAVGMPLFELLPQVTK